MISTIILSAGSSRRMGSPKALLTIGEETFIRQIVEVLLPFELKPIFVVLGADADQIYTSVSTLPVTVVVNEKWREGQLSSLIAGLDAVDERTADGILVWPIDHPLVRKPVVSEMSNAFDNEREKIIIPKYRDRRGHPIIFPKILFDRLRSAPVDTGARSVVRQYSGSIREVDTDDEGVIINIDTPEDYKNYVLKSR